MKLVSRFIHLALIIILVTVQISMATWWTWLTPELCFGVILALSLSQDLLDTIWWVAVAGVLLDLTIGTIPGIYTISFSLFAALIHYVSKQYLDKPSLPIAFLIFIIFALMQLSVQAIVYQAISLQIFFPAFLTAAIACLTYQLILTASRKREVIQFG